MRTFKFRAWDGDKMHEDVIPWQWDFVISKAWHRCEVSTGTGILGSGGKTGEFLVPGIAFKEVMQFTGLLDKNGKEIYEGDVIKVLTGIVYEVMYCSTTGGFRLRNTRTPANGYIFYSSDSSTIIGNIYEK